MEFKIFKKGSNNLEIGIFSSKKYIPDFHHHIEYEIVYIVEGEGNFYIDNKQIPVKPGSVILVEPNVKHCLRNTSKEYLYYAIVFNISALGPENDCCRKIMEQIKINDTLNLPEDMINQIVEVADKANLKIFGQEFKIKTLLYQIISYIIESKQYMQFAKALDYMDCHSKSVQLVCKYIQQHFSEKIDYDELLNQSNYSKSQFIKIFKKETGMNVTDYINQYRIENACLSLLKTNKNITEIAMENGFNNIQYFSKRFKEIMNCTPKEYKANAVQSMSN